MQWNTQLLERVGIVIEGRGRAESPPLDIKSLHAKIGELTLENKMIGNCAQRGRPAERITMIDGTFRFADPAPGQGVGDCPFHCLRPVEAGPGTRTAADEAHGCRAVKLRLLNGCAGR